MGENQKIDRKVIERLRTSRDQLRKESYDHGRGVGREWALNHGEADELEQLRMFREESEEGWDTLFEDPNTDQALAIFEAMHPDAKDDRECFHDFWERIVGGDTHYLGNRQFLRGFAEGVLDAWAEVQHQL